MRRSEAKIAAGLLAFECSLDPQYRTAWHTLYDGTPVERDGDTPLWRALTAPTLMAAIEAYATHITLTRETDFAETVTYYRYLTETV